MRTGSSGEEEANTLQRDMEEAMKHRFLVAGTAKSRYTTLSGYKAPLNVTAKFVVERRFPICVAD